MFMMRSCVLPLALILAPVSSMAREQDAKAGTNASCRKVPTELSAEMTGAGGFTSRTKITCSFNASAKQVNCTARYSDSQGITSESTTSALYGSVADLVDELAVNPPLLYALSISGTQTSSRGKSTGGTANTFDSQRRIVRTVNTSASGESTTTFTEWDTKGRPTRATDAGKGFNNTRVISYDDVARTRTTVVNGGPLRTIETFDADGNQIATVTMSGGAAFATKTTITIAASQNVCK